MNRAEAAAGGVITAIGALMLWQALKLAYSGDGVPGPGFLPRWIAAALVCAGLVLIVKALRPAKVLQEAIAWPDRAGWKRLALLLGALAVALVLLDKLGFMVVTTAFMAVLVFGLGVRSWVMLVTVPLASAIGLYVVFAVWLSVPLPKGIFTFLE
jgi:hypothetical protein